MHASVNRKRQEGMVMLVAVVLLLAVSLMIMAASNLTQNNLKVVKNMESREQVRYAALAAIEEAISSNRFTGSPNNIFTVSYGVNNQLSFDTDGDGERRTNGTDILVMVDPPECVMVSPLKNNELNPYANPSEGSCHSGGDSEDFSLCADTVWEFIAEGSDAVTGTQVQVRQGVSITTTITNITTACP